MILAVSRGFPVVVPFRAVDAACPLDVLAETTDLELPEDSDAETAGGLILEELGRLATPGDSVTVDGVRLTVTKADPTRIRSIRVERLDPATKPTTDNSDD